MSSQKVTCFGTGLIGSAWATNFAIKGAETTLYDLDDDKLAQARTRLEGNLAFFKKVGVLDSAQVEAAMSHVRLTSDPADALRDAEFVQENGPENLAVKQQIIAAIEQHAKEDTIIASSTSGLIVSEIAEHASHPERIVGGHPYNPVHLMPLVELVKGRHTSQTTLDKALAFYRSIGKEPVVLNQEAPGFICNRIQIAVIREAFDLVRRGVCSVEDVDRAVVFGLGLRWATVGPHLSVELGGGTGGFAGSLHSWLASSDVWLEDMATWTKIPDDYAEEHGVPGVTAELAHRKPEQGQTASEVAAFRDRGLIELLRYHNEL